MTAYREHTFTVSGLLGAFAGRIFEEVRRRRRRLVVLLLLVLVLLLVGRAPA
jgi:hypothetical protein